MAAAVAYYRLLLIVPLLLVLASVSGLLLRSHPEWQHRLLDSALAQFRSSAPGSGEVSAPSGALGSPCPWARTRPVGGDRRSQGRPGRARHGRRRTESIATWSAGLGCDVTGDAVGLRRLRPGRRTPRRGQRASREGRRTLLLVVGSRLVSSRVASASEMYGTFAIVIGLLGWIYLGAQLMLLGAVVNVVLIGSLWPRSLRGVRLPADERALRRSAMQEQRDGREHIIVRCSSPAVPDKGVDTRSRG